MPEKRLNHFLSTNNQQEENMDRKKENILKQLKSSGAGFTVPKEYFENLDNQIDKPLETLSDTKEGNPEDKEYKTIQMSLSALDQIKKHHGFKVPQGYFDSIEREIYRPGKPKVITIKNQFIRILSLSIAASILLFFGIQYMNPSRNVNDQLVFEDVEIANWIESDLVHLNAYEIAEVFNEVELEPVLYGEDEVDEYLNYVDIESLILEN